MSSQPFKGKTMNQFNQLITTFERRSIGVQLLVLLFLVLTIAVMVVIYLAIWEKLVKHNKPQIGKSGSIWLLVGLIALSTSCQQAPRKVEILNNSKIMEAHWRATSLESNVIVLARYLQETNLQAKYRRGDTVIIDSTGLISNVKTGEKVVLREYIYHKQLTNH